MDIVRLEKEERGMSTICITGISYNANKPQIVSLNYKPFDVI